VRVLLFKKEEMKSARCRDPKKQNRNSKTDLNPGSESFFFEHWVRKLQCSTSGTICLQVIEYIKFLQEKVQKYESANPERSHEDSKSMPWVLTLLRYLFHTL
jgi:hypothetical protein